MALTADQLSDFQSDLGISNDEAVFTDAELERLRLRGKAGDEATPAGRCRHRRADVLVDLAVADLILSAGA